MLGRSQGEPRERCRAKGMTERDTPPLQVLDPTASRPYLVTAGRADRAFPQAWQGKRGSAFLVLPTKRESFTKLSSMTTLQMPTKLSAMVERTSCKPRLPWKKNLQESKSKG